MNFSTSVAGGTGGNVPYLNSVVAHPELYVCSQLTDENGNLLPISNINIKTDANRGNEDITSYCTISAPWTYNSNGDGKDDVIVYKIDTTNVPDGKAALMTNYVRANTTPPNISSVSSLVITYSIATTALTSSQSYYSRDTVFVRDPNATIANMPTAGMVITSASPLYEAIRNGADWSAGMVAGQSMSGLNQYHVNSVQSILVTSQIKHQNGTDWLTWSTGDAAIPVGVSAGSGFELKSDIVNNAGATVSGTEVYIPIPKAGQNWGALLSQPSQLSLLLKGAASVDATAGSGTFGSYTVKYGVNVAPTDNGATLQGYMWVDAASVTDWSKVNCIQVTAANITDKADLQVVLDCQADPNQTSPALVEGLTDI